MKPLRTLAIIIGVIALFAALYKVYLPIKVKQRLDEAIAAAQPFAHITYRNAKSDFSGKLHVIDLSISPTGEDITVNIGRFSMDFGSPMTMANALIAGIEEIPENLSFRGADIIVDNLPPDLFLEDGEEFGWPKACGPIPLHTIIGNDEHPLELAFGWVRNKEGEFDLDLEYNIENLYRSLYSISIIGVNVENPAFSTPSFRGLELEVIDEGHAKFSVDRCMERASVDAEKAKNLLIQASVNGFTLTRDWAANDITSTAMHKFFDEPGSFLIRSRASKAFEFEDLQGSTVDANAIIRKLSLVLEINGEEVKGFGLVPYTRQAEDDRNKGDFDNEPGRDQGPKTLPIRFSQLTKYKGYTVNLKATDGRIHKGRVLVEDDDRIGIAQNYAGGKWTYYPEPETTVSIEVLY